MCHIFLFSAIFQIYIFPLTLLASPYIYIFSLLLLNLLNIFLVFISFALLHYLIQDFQKGFLAEFGGSRASFCLGSLLESVLGARLHHGRQQSQGMCGHMCLQPRCYHVRSSKGSQEKSLRPSQKAMLHTDSLPPQHTPCPPHHNLKTKLLELNPWRTDKSISWKCFKDAAPSACSWRFCHALF